MNFPTLESITQPKSGPHRFPKWIPAARVGRPGTERAVQLPDSDGDEVGAVIGATSTKTMVTLLGVDSLEPTVILGRNQYGQLPAVLVDPIDSSGQVAVGTWLGDGYDGTEYQLTRRRGVDQNPTVA